MTFFRDDILYILETYEGKCYTVRDMAWYYKCQFPTKLNYNLLNRISKLFARIRKYPEQYNFYVPHKGRLKYDSYVAIRKDSTKFAIEDIRRDSSRHGIRALLEQARQQQLNIAKGIDGFLIEKEILTEDIEELKSISLQASAMANTIDLLLYRMRRRA